MNTEGYLLLFRGDEWDAGRSDAEVQRIMDEVMQWFDGLQLQGKVKGGQPLAREGRLVSGGPGRSRVVADGPFTESKEVIGGYLLLNVASMDEAVAIAKSCPTLDQGIAIEVRPVLDECPVYQRVRQRLSAIAA